MLQGQSWVSKVRELQCTGCGRQHACCRKQTGELLALTVSILKPKIHWPITFTAETMHCHFLFDLVCSHVLVTQTEDVQSFCLGLSDKTSAKVMHL